jgi:transketolase
MGREPVPVVTRPEDPFVLGRALTMEEGTDGTILACGLMVPVALEAADRLRAKGIRPRVLNMASIKPIDREAVLLAARETGAIVTAEEHNMYGGLGSAVCEIVAQSDCRVPVKIIAVQDRYLESGPMEDLMALAGLTPAAVAQALEGMLRKVTS